VESIELIDLKKMRLFDVATSGGAGSRWFTHLLNQHKDVIALNGYREISFWGQKHPSVEQMIMGLRNFGNHAAGKAVIGLIHTHFGTESREVILREGGRFMAVFRDPIMRINSLFHHHLRDNFGVPLIDNDAFKTVCENGSLSKLEESFPNFFLKDRKNLTRAENGFSNILNQVIPTDIKNFLTITDDEVCKFEWMTTSVDYCNKKISYLFQVENFDFSEIIEPCLNKKMHRHDFKDTNTVEKIFVNWPEQFKRLFATTVESVGAPKFLRVYSMLGYDEAVAVMEKYLKENEENFNWEDDEPIQQAT